MKVLQRWSFINGESKDIDYFQNLMKNHLLQLPKKMMIDDFFKRLNCTKLVILVLIFVIFSAFEYVGFPDDPAYYSIENLHQNYYPIKTRINRIN